MTEWFVVMVVLSHKTGSRSSSLVRALLNYILHWMLIILSVMRQSLNQLQTIEFKVMFTLMPEAILSPERQQLLSSMITTMPQLQSLTLL